MAKKRESETEAITLRIEKWAMAQFRALAAEATVKSGGAVAVTAQDLMRDWLGKHPRLKKPEGVDGGPV
ncbi:hypothetical protein [Trinickia mobilis]|uniref:hypothetical protein n=1 Tax=Trinickia mobilis TaxID=2816356 RepID=UPI001A907045|nr:hypothetical protein [Trinickia mobilis]